MAEGIEHAVQPTEAAAASLDQPLASISAAMMFGVLVFLAMATAPIMLGGLVQAGRLSNGTLGLVATLETLGIAGGSSFGPRFLGAGHIRLKVAACCLVLAALNWGCMGALDPQHIAVLRGGCGLLEGLVLSAANLILTYTRNPEGMSGYFLGITTIPQVAATYLLSSYAIPRWGPNVGFAWMAATAILAGVAAAAISGETIPKARGEEHGQGRWSLFALAALATIALQNAAVGAGYSYIVQIAKQQAVPDGVIGLSLATLQVTAVVGSLAVGFVGWRASQALVLSIGCLVQVAVVLVILRGGIAYAIGAALFGLCWNALLPFSLKLLIELDPTRRLALLNSPASLTGFSLGPLLVAGLVSEKDVSPAFLAAAVMFAAAAGLYGAINIFSRGARIRASA